MTQSITVTTFVKLDLVDSIKVLFGRTIKIDTNIEVPQSQPIESYNAGAQINIVKTGAHFTKQDRPNFGWVSRG